LQAVESGKPVVVPDTAADNRLQYLKEIEEEGIGAIVTFPVFARDQVIGVLRIFSPTPRVFSYEEIQLTSTIADRIGIAFRNAQEQANNGAR
jgi:GAF domain-containing protein